MSAWRRVWQDAELPRGQQEPERQPEYVEPKGVEPIEVDQVWVSKTAKAVGEWKVRWAGKTVVVLEGLQGTEITLRPEVLHAQYVLKLPPVFEVPTMLVELRSPRASRRYWVVERDMTIDVTWPRTGRRALVKDVRS